MNKKIFSYLISFARSIVVILISTIFSVTLTIVFIDGCFNPENAASPNMFCGNIGQVKVDMKEPLSWLKGDDFRKTLSFTTEHDNPSYAVKNIIDGDYNTIASPPGGYVIDYVVELSNVYEIKKIELVWKDQGTNGRNVKNWSLSIRNPNGDWEETVNSKDPPYREITFLKTDFTTDALRLKAGPSDSNLGIYEIRIFGRPEL